MTTIFRAAAAGLSVLALATGVDVHAQNYPKVASTPCMAAKSNRPVSPY